MRGTKVKALARLARSLGYVKGINPASGRLVNGVRRFRRWYIRKWGKTPEVERG